MTVSSASTEPPFVFEFQPPPQEEMVDYYDPFVFNEDGTVDLDINGKARVRGERLRVDGRLRVMGNAFVEGDLIVQDVDILAEIELLKQSIANNQPGLAS
jgi:hypothetical protein